MSKKIRVHYFDKIRFYKSYSDWKKYPTEYLSPIQVDYNYFLTSLLVQHEILDEFNFDDLSFTSIEDDILWNRDDGVNISIRSLILRDKILLKEFPENYSLNQGAIAIIINILNRNDKLKKLGI